MPFLCFRRQDIPNGVLQISDLWPRRSQPGSIFNPVAQGPIYVRQPEFENVFTAPSGADVVTRTEFCGVAAYLLDNIDDGGGALASADAIEIALALIAEALAGNPLTETDIDAVIQATAGGASLTGGTSTGTVVGVLRVLSGDRYCVPAGSVVEAAGAFNGPNGSFETSPSQDVYYTGQFDKSVKVGLMAGFADSSFVYNGVTGASIVVYADDGTVLS